MRYAKSLSQVTILASLLIIFIIACARKPLNSLQEAVDDVMSQPVNPMFSYATPKTLLYSDQHDNYAFVVVADSQTPQLAIGHMMFVLVDLGKGDKWTLLRGAGYRVESTTLYPDKFAFGGTISRDEATKRPLDKNTENAWSRAFDQLLTAHKLTIATAAN